MILGGLRALLRIRPRAEPSARGVAQRDLDIGVGTQQIFRIRVDCHEFHILQTLGNHSVDCIATCATDTNDLDDRGVVEIVGLGDLAHVSLLSLTVVHNCTADG